LVKTLLLSTTLSQQTFNIEGLFTQTEICSNTMVHTRPPQFRREQGLRETEWQNRC